MKTVLNDCFPNRVIFLFFLTRTFASLMQGTHTWIHDGIPTSAQLTAENPRYMIGGKRATRPFSIHGKMKHGFPDSSTHTTTKKTTVSDWQFFSSSFLEIDPLFFSVRLVWEMWSRPSLIRRIYPNIDMLRGAGGCCGCWVLESDWLSMPLLADA
ncbi:hypothetical protein DM02DRAFT_306343 [Periconia macrospinosa]|uniref:Secreted protein n=1 Tax=Periconia macrospinosa TaxID=97972 RepID=A0A2V1DVP6_9PLEO|nr:hypothetical protein DM02DRAFT_306343 [Periconia macrospinosa]